DLLRIAGHGVACPDRDERRAGYPSNFVWRQRLARAANAGGERGAIALGLVSEGAKCSLLRVGQLFERGGLHRIGDTERQPDALHQMVAEPAENQRAHAAWMDQAEKGG